jgi:hypothetical protein
MSQEKSRKSYLVLSVLAMAILLVAAVSIGSSDAPVSTNSLSGAKTTQDETDDNTDTNDGLSVSDGDGETNDDNNK